MTTRSLPHATLAFSLQSAVRRDPSRSEWRRSQACARGPPPGPPLHGQSASMRRPESQGQRGGLSAFRRVGVGPGAAGRIGADHRAGNASHVATLPFALVIGLVIGPGARWGPSSSGAAFQRSPSLWGCGLRAVTRTGRMAGWFTRQGEILFDPPGRRRGAGRPVASPAAPCSGTYVAPLAIRPSAP